MSGAKRAWRSLPLLIQINACVVGAFALGWVALQFGWPYLLIPAGLAAFFVPAYNLTIALERLGGRQGTLRTAMWVIILSLTMTPTAVWAVTNAIGGNPIELAQPAFLGFWLASVGIAAIFETFGKPLPPAPALTNRRELLVVLGLFAASILGAAVVYPFIPEADSYTYLIKLREVVADPSLLTGDGRPLFTILLHTASEIVGVSPYWILKLGVPLLGATLVLTSYAVAEKLVSNRWLRIVTALGPLYFPIVIQELLISRPQSVFLLVIAPAVYLLGQLSLEREKIGSIYWILLLLVIGLVGFKIHALFAFLFLVGVAAVFVFFAPRIRRRPLDALVVGSATLVAVYPWIADTGLIGDLEELAALFGKAFRDNHFIWWFLSNYHNVDGNETGWPGLTGAIYYYGYNLGLFVPGALLLWLATRRSRTKSTPNRAGYLWPIAVMVGAFFFVAEIAPRFRLAFLPDRAWLFIALGIGLALPWFFRRPGQLTTSNLSRYLLLTLGAAAILSSWGLTHAKQGWIAPKDYPAAAFIRDELPKDAVVLSQGGNHVLIRYFAESTMVRPPEEVVMSPGPTAVTDFLNEQARRLSYESGLNAERRAIVDRDLAKIDPAASDPTSSAAQVYATHIAILKSERTASLAALEQIKRSYIKPTAPVYLLYSRNKFDSLYGSRAWWRTSNFYGAPLEKFNVYPVVYNQNGVTIWEIRP